MTRVTFPGYTHTQLMKIIESRLTDVSGNVVEPDAIQFASRKVAAVSGDARRALDICRRAVEIAESDGRVTESEPTTPSKRRRGKEASSPRLEERLSRVTIHTIKLAITEATSTPTQQYLKSLPLSSKIFLVAFVARIRRCGVSESMLRDILEEAKRLVNAASDPTLDDLNAKSIPSNANSLILKHPRKVSAACVLAMGASAVALAEAGVISLETRKGERTARLRLHTIETDIKLALRGDTEIERMRLSAW